MKKQSKRRKKDSDISVPNEEFDYWDRRETDRMFDWSNAKINIFPNLRPSSQSTTIRWPDPLLNRIKLLANKRNIPYQSLVKTVMADFVNHELRKAS